MLPTSDAQVQRARHERRVDAWTSPHLDRRRRGEKHAVWDFLFDYYRLSPARLRQWHPGRGVVLPAGEAPPGPYVEVPGGVMVGPPPERAGRTVALLQATAGRPAQFGCFGLHEWAMVYRAPDRRHALPLRLGQAGTDAVVEAHPLRCSHFDAFRFFSSAAVPRNAPLSRERQVDDEQPGCLHAGMDLYRWAGELQPWVGSDLVADCFDLARRIRLLDMQASPYDLTPLGEPSVAVETPAGKADYARRQRAFSDEAQVLRGRLLQALT